MTEDQATFFDRMYPQISQRLHDLEQSDKSTHMRLVDMKSHIKVMELTVEQYKKKIQKIEQLLIEHGLTKILKGKKDE